MKKTLVTLAVLLGISANAVELTPFMTCAGKNQYNERVLVKVLTGKSNGLSSSVSTQLILTKENDTAQTIVNGTILNNPDMLSTYQFISEDDRIRFLTSGTLYSLDSYFYRVSNLKCKTLKAIFTSNGTAR